MAQMYGFVNQENWWLRGVRCLNFGLLLDWLMQPKYWIGIEFSFEIKFLLGYTLF